MQRLGFISFSSQLVLCIQAPANVWESRRDSDGIPKIFHNHAKGESCNMEATMNVALCFLFLWNAASFHMLKGGQGIGPWRRVCLRNIVATFSTFARHSDANQKGANLGGNERQLLRLEINQRESNEGKFGTLSKCGISVYSQKYNKQHIWQIWFLKMSPPAHVLIPWSSYNAN